MLPGHDLSLRTSGANENKRVPHPYLDMNLPRGHLGSTRKKPAAVVLIHFTRLQFLLFAGTLGLPIHSKSMPGNASSLLAFPAGIYGFL